MAGGKQRHSRLGNISCHGHRIFSVRWLESSVTSEIKLLAIPFPMSSAKQFLQLTEVKSLLTAQTLVSVQTTSTVGEALALLLEKRIQSLPVFDKARNRFNTFIDTVDIATHAMRVR